MWWLIACSGDQTLPGTGQGGVPACEAPLPAHETPVEGLQFDGEPPQSLLLVVLDTLRRDTVAAYNPSLPTMPCLQSRSDHLVRFDNAFAVGSWTGINTASMMTGLLPENHGLLRVDSQAGEPELDDPFTAPTFASHLQEQGYTTALVSGNPWVSEAGGFAQGFDHYTADPGAWGHTDAAALSAEVRSLLAGIEAPFFLHWQPVDNHYPYLPPEPYRDAFVDTDAYPWPVTYAEQESILAQYAWASAGDQDAMRTWLAGLYAAETLSADAEIDGVIADLEATGRLDDTLVVVTADHGETLDDDGSGYFGHGSSLRGELVNLPLLAYHPRLRPGTVSTLLRTTDVIPVALSAMGVAIPGDTEASVAGHDFAYGVRFPNDDDALEVVEAYAQADGVKVVRDCRATSVAAYDLAADPAEASPAWDLATVPGAAALARALDAQLSLLQAGADRYTPCLASD